MERLTDVCWKNLDPWECCGQGYYCTRGCHDKGGCINGCIVPKLYARLAAYEDSGWMPEMLRKLGENAGHMWDFAQAAGSMTIGRLKELAEADKDRRVVILPCKVGGYRVVYTIGIQAGGRTDRGRGAMRSKSWRGRPDIHDTDGKWWAAAQIYDGANRGNRIFDP